MALPAETIRPVPAGAQLDPKTLPVETIRPVPAGAQLGLMLVRALKAATRATPPLVRPPPSPPEVQSSWSPCPDARSVLELPEPMGSRGSHFPYSPWCAPCVRVHVHCQLRERTPCARSPGLRPLSTRTWMICMPCSCIAVAAGLDGFRVRVAACIG